MPEWTTKPPDEAGFYWVKIRIPEEEDNLEPGYYWPETYICEGVQQFYWRVKDLGKERAFDRDNLEVSPIEEESENVFYYGPVDPPPGLDDE